MPLKSHRLLAANRSAEGTTNCDSAIAPACIKAITRKRLDQFYTSFAPSIPASTGPKVDTIDGGTAPGPQSGGDGEADLEFDITILIVYPQGTELYQTVANNDDIFNTFADADQRQCDEFMKLGLQGTTLVLSSGDDGVARRSGPSLGPNQDIFSSNTAED
ncbi:Aorsin [Tolypocladium ophioglossoides CBS 100239]|uniref:Aorsin n=1 Tax=Tolypocladium ophioglossoides (strain CBS 100239) TaxID=1163406 RepID=A0A0L0N2J3_TOLOC|nr:Aorsin [Tolypocladium ophioglossoides CBS 100239]